MAPRTRSSKFISVPDCTPTITPTSPTMAPSKRTLKAVSGPNCTLTATPPTLAMAPPKRSLEVIPVPKWTTEPAEIPMEVWANVLELGFDLKDLFGLRLVSRKFLGALQLQKVWKEARLRTYGSDCPGPPAGLTEFEYARLLLGKGCQAPDCKVEASRTYWAFKKRLCHECYRKQVFAKGFVLDLNPRSIDLLFPFTTGSSSRYICTGHSGRAPSYSRPEYASYHKDAAFEAIASAAKLDTMSEIEKDDWYCSQKAIRDTALAQLQQCDTFFTALEEAPKIKARALQAEAKQYFIDMALAMNPPLTKRALGLCPSYWKAFVRQIDKEKEALWAELVPKLTIEGRRVNKSLARERRRW